VYLAVLLASLVGEVVSAYEQVFKAYGEVCGDTQVLITREWTWSDGASTTTFTAHGPPDQVNSLDPENGIVECPDCELASSVQFGTGDVATED
jgi:hypothetical protein